MLLAAEQRDVSFVDATSRLPERLPTAQSGHRCVTAQTSEVQGRHRYAPSHAFWPTRKFSPSYDRLQFAIDRFLAGKISPTQLQSWCYAHFDQAPTSGDACEVQLWTLTLEHLAVFHRCVWQCGTGFCWTYWYEYVIASRSDETPPDARVSASTTAPHRHRPTLAPGRNVRSTSSAIASGKSSRPGSDRSQTASGRKRARTSGLPLGRTSMVHNGVCLGPLTSVL